MPPSAAAREAYRTFANLDELECLLLLARLRNLDELRQLDRTTLDVDFENPLRPAREVPVAPVEPRPNATDSSLSRVMS
jgi:hypothetical protein